MILSGTIETCLIDKNGQPLEEPCIRLMKSYVGNFIRCLFVMMQQNDANSGILSTTGGAIFWSAHLLRLDAPVTNANYGIVVGSGSTPTVIGTTALQTKIAHGAAANQLYHQACLYEAPIHTSSTSEAKIKRTFDNASSDTTRVVREVALYAGNTTYTCIARDVLNPVFNIPLGTSGQISYVLRVIF